MSENIDYKAMYQDTKDDYISTLNELQESEILLRKCKKFIVNNVCESDVYDVELYKYICKELGIK